MTNLPFQKPKIRLHGDKEEAQRYVGGATALLHQVEMIMARSGVSVFANKKTLDDGAVIYAGVFGQERIIQVWSASFFSEEEEDRKIDRPVRSLSWLPVGFYVTPDNASGPIPQTFLTPLERNNYPRDVYRANGGGGGLEYAPIFHDGEEVVGMSAGNLQEDPRFNPILFSSEPSGEWYALPTEAIPLEEVFGGDALICAELVLANTSNSSVVPPIMGLYTSAIRSTEGEDDIDDFLIRSGLPTTELFTTTATTPQQAAGTFISALNGLFDDPDNSSRRWMIDVAKRGEYYYLTASFVAAGGVVSGAVNTTIYGKASAYGSFSSRQAMLGLNTTLLSDFKSDSVMVRGRRFYFRAYTDQYSVLGAALVGDGVLGLVVFQQSGSSRRLHYDTWSTLDIDTQLSRTTYTLSSKQASTSSIVFSDSGQKCAMLLWELEPHQNSYLESQTCRFGRRSIVGDPSFGTRVRVLRINNGVWSSGSLQGIWANVHVSTAQRTMSTDEVVDMLGDPPTNDEGEPSTGPRATAQYEAGYWTNGWRLRTSRYTYSCQGSVPQALQFDGEDLVIADLEFDIEIEQQCSIGVWKDIAGNSTLDPDETQGLIEYEVWNPVDNEFMDGLFVFDAIKLGPSSDNTLLRSFRSVKTLRTPTYSHVVSRAGFASHEGEELIPDCYEDKFHFLDLLDRNKNHFIRQYPSSDDNLAPMNMQWYVNNTPAGAPITNVDGNVDRRPARGEIRPIFLAAGALMHPNVFQQVVNPVSRATRQVWCIGTVIYNTTADQIYQQQGVGITVPSNHVTAEDHWADVAPMGISTTDRLGLPEGSDWTWYSTTQAPKGIRVGNARGNIDQTVNGERLVAMIEPSLLRVTGGVPTEWWYRNWSTLPIQELLGVAEDEKLVPAGVF